MQPVNQNNGNNIQNQNPTKYKQFKTNHPTVAKMIKFAERAGGGVTGAWAAKGIYQMKKDGLSLDKMIRVTELSGSLVGASGAWEVKLKYKWIKELKSNFNEFR